MHFLKKLRKDRRGNVLAITAAALPLVVGAAGLATDTIQWTTWKRQLQRAADSAAFAGAYAKAQDAAVADAVDSDLDNNWRNRQPAPLRAGFPQIDSPPVGGFSDTVRVRLETQRRLSFSSLFLSSAPVIRTSATAALVDDGEYCVRALYKGKAEPGITIGGSSNSVLGCKALSNSSSPTESVKINGGAHNFVSPKVAGAGGMPSSINGTTEISPYHMPLPDPFENKYPTTLPGGSCNKQVQPNQTALTEGCYKDFKFTGNGTYTLGPGVYYLNNTDFDVAGGVTVKGTGVTIILTGSSPGSIKTNGNSGIQLTAPTSGTYEDMLFIQAANAATDNDNQINGNNTSKYDGAIYIPKGKVDFSGNSGPSTKCVMVVAYKVVFTGNSNLQNDVVDCDANKTVQGKTIRLVA